MNKFFNNLDTTQRILVLAIAAVIVFGASTAVSYTLFASSAKQAAQQAAAALPTSAGGFAENPNEPKTETCPLNGSMHTKEAKQIWDTHRPLAVMIENHTDARPQSGLSSADVVYEAVAEGGITRFMGVFLCNVADTQVGPVRSARTYFLDWESEYNALYAHVGGANTPGPANALGQIIDYKVDDLNQMSGCCGYPTYWRDYQRLGHPVATEHTMYSTTNKLFDAGKAMGWTASDSAGVKWDANFVQWKFKDDQPGGTTTKITVPFWAGFKDYEVEWAYDSSCNCYKRSNGGAPHLDLDNNQQLSPKVVVVQFETEAHANDGYDNNVHLLYGTKGSGKALIFEDGKVTEGTWNKANRLAREKFLDKNGQEIAFNKGQIWIQTIPIGNTVTY